MLTALCYLLGINGLTLALMGLDKHRAKRGGRRVAELTFFSLALMGGSIGAILGMYVFHHKTRHWYFRYGLPALLLAQLVFLWFVVYGVSLLA